MQAISNSGLLNICNVCGTSGFIPAVSYVYDAAAKTIVFTEASTIPGTDALTIVHVHVTDAMGGRKYGKITAAAGTVTINTATLNPIEGYTLQVTVVLASRSMGDLSVYRVGSSSPASGNLGYLNKSQESNNTSNG